MIPYIGGKSYLASWIISNFPENFREMSYCEVFGGGGWVLFKKEPSFLETYNDLNKHLVNLFRVIRDNYEEFSFRADWSLHSREMYNEAKDKLQNDKFLSDVESAMHYAVDRLQTFSAGNSNSWGYAVTADKIISGKWRPFVNRLSLINPRLKRVQIECLDFEKIIEKYDGKNALFYLDPPYVGVEFYYTIPGVDFKYEDHKRLSSILKNIKGKFVLSYYDDELIRKLYKKNRIITKETAKHSCGMTRNTKIKVKPRGKELLIMNY